MTAERYGRIAAWFRARPMALRLLALANRALPLLFYLLYPALLLWLAARGDARLPWLTAFPAGAFLTCTVLRKAVKAARPAEALGIKPLLSRRKAGRDSFPSRHMTCAAAIASAYGAVSPPAGCILGLLALAIALVRVLGGIHFPRDVLAGGILGALFGAAAFFAV